MRFKKLSASVLLALSVGFSYVAPVALPVGATGILVTQTSCDKNKIREARKAAYRIQVVTDAAIDTTSSLHERGVIDNAQTLKIAQALLKVNHANRLLIERAANMTEDTAANRAALVGTVREISGAIKELKDAGVLGIKNPDGSAAFDAAISALDTSLALIEAALGGQ